jgi:predicted N-acyltransferase
MRLEVRHRISDISATEWNALAGAEQPFLRHEFLAALEECRCVHPDTGWLPWHLTLRDGDRLVAAAPAYLKGHSWGEFVFDWAWADAHERHGLGYYPKLISAVPYSPITGARVLIAPGFEPRLALDALARGARQLADSQELSSLHWLFPETEQADALEAAGYLRRSGCQFHWSNRGYGSFDDFLGELSSKKRKNIRQERAAVAAAGVEFVWLQGSEIDDAAWSYFLSVYTDTFERHHNLPPLNLKFFRRIGREIEENVLLVLARRHGRPIAAALCLRDDHALYGRYWGASDSISGLHFETCYYQGIEYCIRHGLQRFEPGAQGEHKVPRGFLPTLTHSAHWLRNSQMRAAIAHHLRHERERIAAYAAEMNRHSPYRQVDEVRR